MWLMHRSYCCCCFVYSAASSSISAICRICHDSGDGEELLTPCNCRGTVGYMHRSCIERWLATANRDKCDICSFSYSVARRHGTFCQVSLDYFQFWRDSTRSYSNTRSQQSTKIYIWFYSALLAERGTHCYGKSSVRLPVHPSVRDAEVSWLHRLE